MVNEDIFIEEEVKKDHKILKRVILVIGIFLFLVGCVLLYSRFIGTSGLFVKEYKVVHSTIPEYFHGLKIVHFSDVHYGRTVHQKELVNLVEKINELHPDIVVLTGDLIDDDTVIDNDVVTLIVNELKKIDARIGKYAIMGNHDYQFQEWATIIKNSNFVNLNDTYDLIYDNGYEPIMLAGISTNLHGTKNIKDKSVPIFTYFSGLNKKVENENGEEVSDPSIVKPVYEILLMHEPDFIEEIDYNKFDLILAGHSHNGQVRFPFIGAVIKPVGADIYYDEYYSLDQTELYISSGIGVSTVNFRLFNRPSINFYRIVNH